MSLMPYEMSKKHTHTTTPIELETVLCSTPHHHHHQQQQQQQQWVISSMVLEVGVGVNNYKL